MQCVHGACGTGSTPFGSQCTVISPSSCVPTCWPGHALKHPGLMLVFYTNVAQQRCPLPLEGFGAVTCVSLNKAAANTKKAPNQPHTIGLPITADMGGC
mmetsp:Transcript_40175/g.66999  ORF Transcript_40175/g.66999 Transcript_40175/m.66999 type:complete len:99 (-) Transcript_40175:685-981(-)